MTTELAFNIQARDNASRAIDNVGDTAERSGRRVGGMSDKMKTFAKLGAVAVAAGAVMAGKALFDMAQGAAEDQAAAAKLAKTLQNTANATDKQIASVESWISAQGVALGVTDDELRPALERLVSATNDVSKAQRLTSLAMDVSAGTGKSLEQVSTALMKAQNGQVAGLSRLGVKTKDANGETISFEQAVKRLAQTHGGQATTKANTYAGKMNRLKLVYNETKETIGAKLLPMLTVLGTWFLNKGIPLAGRMSRWLDKNLGPAFAGVGKFITQFAIPAAKAFFTWYAQKIVPHIRDAAIPIINKIKKGFADLSVKVAENRPQLQQLWAAFKKVAEYVASKVYPALSKLYGHYLSRLFDALGIVIDSIGTAVDGFITLKNAIEDVGDAIRNIPKPDFPDLPDLPGLGRLGGLGGSSSGKPDVSGTPAPSAPTADQPMTKRDLEGLEIKVVGLDPGQKAYLQFGGGI